MELKIPSKKALEIFEKRKQEISQYGFEPLIWKSKVENDCREIFGGVDFRCLDIGKIKFITSVTSAKESTMAKGKIQATKLMESFIEQIEEYSQIAELKSKKSEKYYESEYNKLTKETSRIITQANELIIDQNNLLDELREQDTEIERLKNETVQLSNISLSKLLKLIGNLPLVQSVGLITTFIGIIGFAIYCGTLIEKSTNQSNQLENKTQIQKFLTKEEKLIDSLNVLNKKVNAQSGTIMQLKKQLLKESKTIKNKK
ncbi:hypothetical protein [uncultured Tenacibaculum sp.]|uniref:hypothetical protein n=1 Tax=uncultured Tenacibaculum sp. TaxID=174713 RepID=UPI002637B994|nr:hypothetical protein [uncultured Tenacibaculum sp.]